MSVDTKKKELADRRKNRVRKKIKEVNRTGKPRIFFAVTNKHLYAQLINDESGATLMSVSSLHPKLRQPGKSLKNKEYAKKLAELFVETMQEKSLKLDQGYVFDRGASLYHGRVQVFAETLREKGVVI
ncbi:MAG: 50S ribosomal protein L18 [Leptospiraceae bacterium]|nr:50S ribosomal protein L18 [Leptospiraceae bacterium]MCB1202051.1 50S ribosomal protein L18 [Leptospiraceae bacterium]